MLSKMYDHVVTLNKLYKFKVIEKSLVFFLVDLFPLLDHPHC